MATYLYLHCKACGEDVEVYCNGDDAMMCPECQTIDEFEDVEEEIT